MVIDSTKTVRELAVEFPSAARVFEAMRIDYCCGGAKSLAAACAAADVAVEAVTQSLEQAEQARTASAEFTDWAAATLSELTAHIVAKHHLFTRQEIERLDPLLAKVCSVHEARHPELPRIMAVFKELAAELTAHMQKEEAVLFPYIEQMEDTANRNQPLAVPFFGAVHNPIRMMMLEHDGAGEMLKRIRRLSRDFTAPDGACPSYRTLYQALEAFEQDLHRHIHLENNILFPRAVELQSKS